jgi:catechol 2,3-dioxygenase-like lactoylglutathione lyase family enzyme
VVRIDVPLLNSILLYVRNIEDSITFYEQHFGFSAKRFDGDRLVELHGLNGGTLINLHLAAKGLQRGQSRIKLSFAIRDVEAFVAKAAANGLNFGPLHKADGYVFANAKDPDGNPISVSSRTFRSTLQKQHSKEPNL